MTLFHNDPRVGYVHLMAKDFSRKKTLEPFTADGDTFVPTPGAAAMLVGSIVGQIQTADGLEAKMEAITSFFDAVLTDESAALMRERLSSKTNPLDINQAMEIIGYLTEEIGERPTQPSSSSSDGSATGETGTSSTAGAVSEVSTLSSSVLTASAT